MTKIGVKKAGEQPKAIQKILITQPKPESEKSPYFELSRRYNLVMDFHPFIRLEGIPARDFRKQKIEIQNYTGVIFTSRNAIDHFFRICEEMKVCSFPGHEILLHYRSGCTLSPKIYSLPQAQSVLWRGWHQ